MRRPLAALLLCFTTVIAGCHSHYIQATVTNHSSAEIGVLQVEYPGAAFGTQSIASGASFQYRFKLLGSGDLKVTWTDASHHDHTVTGPHLNEGQEGSLSIDFPAQAEVTFATGLRP